MNRWAEQIEDGDWEVLDIDALMQGVNLGHGPTESAAWADAARRIEDHDGRG